MNRKLKGRIFMVIGKQADFAERVGVSESLVSAVINERRKLDLSQKKQWAKALRCKVQEIFE